MQIPVYKKDLAEYKFSSIARQIKQNWPEKIKLSKAQAIFSKCLGYEDMHGVTRHANSPSNILNASVTDQHFIFDQCIECLTVEFGLSKEGAVGVMAGIPLDLTCTVDDFAKSLITEIASQQYFNAIKELFISGISKPIIIGSEYQPSGIYSVLDIINVTGTSRNIISPEQSLKGLSALDGSKTFGKLVDNFLIKCMSYALDFPDVRILNSGGNLSRETGCSIDRLIQYLKTLEVDLVKSLIPMLPQLHDVKVEVFYLKHRLANGFYRDYRTEMPESLKGRKLKDGIHKLWIGRDGYSYDSLPWTLHDFSSNIYDTNKVLSACVDGSVYVSKCSYSVDGADLVYAADHVDDLDVSMANQAMEQIASEFGDGGDDYTDFFDNHVIIFIQNWERRVDAPAGLGGRLLEKTILDICRKYEMPAILVCRSNSPKILSDNGDVPAFREIVSRAQRRVIESYSKVFHRIEEKYDCLEHIYYTGKMFDRSEVQRTIGSFYGELFKDFK